MDRNNGSLVGICSTVAVGSLNGVDARDVVGVGISTGSGGFSKLQAVRDASVSTQMKANSGFNFPPFLLCSIKPVYNQYSQIPAGIQYQPVMTHD